jgi:hypothetical protein
MPIRNRKKTARQVYVSAIKGTALVEFAASYSSSS